MTNELLSVNRSVQPIDNYIDRDSVVVDCGCYGWRLSEPCQSAQARLIGVDRSEPPGRPNGVDFAAMKGTDIDLPNETADLVIASHILEHLQEPLAFMQELMRITRPGGVIWIESPSELSALRIASSDPEDHSFVSFWDDPTHVRPWSPGALYRLAISCRCVPVGISRSNADGIPSCRMVCRKPIDDYKASTPKYVGLRSVNPGISNAWNHIWSNA